MNLGNLWLSNDNWLLLNNGLRWLLLMLLHWAGSLIDGGINGLSEKLVSFFLFRLLLLNCRLV